MQQKNVLKQLMLGKSNIFIAYLQERYYNAKTPKMLALRHTSCSKVTQSPQSYQCHHFCKMT